MKILMISKACVAGPYQRKLEELARCADVQLTVVVPTYWREGERRLECEWAHLEGYRMVTLPLAFNGNFHLHFYRRLNRVFDEVKPDLVHADEEPYNLATWQCFRLARQYGAKAVFFTWQNLLRRYPFPFSWIERSIYRQAAHAIAGNAEAVDVLRAKGYHGPATVIPQFGVDPVLYARQDVAERPAGFHIAFVGRLVEEKGVAVLLRAVAQLPAPWTLTIVGDGPQRAELLAFAAELGVSGQVRFSGNIPYGEMPRFYSTLDVLVLPSLTSPHWKEQFGRVLVEAMACRVSVVGSASGEIPNVIGDAGLVFPEGDATALSRALGRLQSDPALRRNLADLGHARVLERFTQEQVARATRAVYREALGEGRPVKVLLNAHLLSFGRTYRAAGISRYIEHSVRALQRVDQENRYELWTGPQEIPPDFLTSPNLSARYTLWPTDRPQARILWEQTVLPARLAVGDYDLLHAMAFVQPLVCPRPSVVTFYDLSFILYPERFNRLNREYLTRLGRRTASSCRRIIAISQSTKSDLVRLFGVSPEKVDVVYPGVEEQFQRLAPATVEEFRRRKGLPERFILHVGTLEPRKNVEILVHAFARLKRGGLPHKLVLVGGRGWDCERIFAAIEEEGLTGEVVEAGFAPEAELPLWYNSAELLTYPSLYEGFGLPPLEAMACGTPVACCAVASLPEVVGDAGVLAPPNDVEALVEAMYLLLSDLGRREEAAARGLAQAARFSWNEAARDMVRTYQRALEQVRRGAMPGD